MPSDDERMLAALAHASIIMNGFSGGGIIAAAAIWATQRGRSPFVARHALQALLFQGLGLLLTLLGLLFWGGCMALGLLPALLRPDLYAGGPPPFFWLALLLGVALLSFVLGGVAYALVAAAQAWRGQPFSYALVGRLALPAEPRPRPAAITGPLAAPEAPAGPPEAPAPAEAPPPTDNEP
jgi:uncharacterized Tic20 family protein